MGRQASARSRRPLRVATLAALAAGAAAALLVARGASAPALAFGKRSFLAKIPTKIPTAIRFGDYELRRTKGFMGLPAVELGRVTKFPIEFMGTTVSTDSDPEDLRGFPYSTSNVAKVNLGLRPVDGRLKLRLKDPGLGVDDLDYDGRQIDAEYEQIVPGIGAVRGHASSSGDWNAAVSSDFPEIGRLHAAVDSHMDWSVRLDRNYTRRMGLAPSASYGVTQDGMVFRANVSGSLGPSSLSYEVDNPPGIYAPDRWVHKGQVGLDSPGGHHKMVLRGMYSPHLPKSPLRGSFSYTAQGKPGSFQASIHDGEYRLRADRGRFGIAAVVGRNDEEDVGSNVELQLRAGVVTATARAVGERARVGVGLDL